MNRADINDLFRYNEWANERLAAALMTLPHEAFTRHLGGSYPRSCDAFAHVVSVEWIWLERWHGTSPKAAPAWASSTDAALLVERMREVDARRAKFLSSYSDDDLHSTVSFTLLSGASGEQRLCDLFVHVANHSTYHRGQVASMLRQAGTAPPSTDFIAYRKENPAKDSC